MSSTQSGRGRASVNVEKEECVTGEGARTPYYIRCEHGCVGSIIAHYHLIITSSSLYSPFSFHFLPWLL